MKFFTVGTLLAAVAVAIPIELVQDNDKRCEGLDCKVNTIAARDVDSTGELEKRGYYYGDDDYDYCDYYYDDDYCGDYYRYGRGRGFYGGRHHGGRGHYGGRGFGGRRHGSHGRFGVHRGATQHRNTHHRSH
ncbi:hypothetical protein HIM_05301 [Hirsutella minnesotensis 3608]|uniref:Uncharacterized protein n=1 Tax=Hirsutella minnesotensis 3608 TaxID=1043627 RepID=A0A0F7ZPE8_9HYPO|nr:hypothetical protein HIM_05301 [Hirsutella minnesotensis 3608]